MTHTVRIIGSSRLARLARAADSARVAKREAHRAQVLADLRFCAGSSPAPFSCSDADALAAAECEMANLLHVDDDENGGALA